MRTYKCTSKGPALFLAVLMALSVLPAAAFAAEDEVTSEPGDGESGAAEYVLMNIPYDEFYAAEIQNDIAVDAVSSATRNKPRTGTLAGGSYHEKSDGTEITGVTYWVKVDDTASEWLAEQKRVTDADSVEITVTNRGETTTTTYAGKDALFENDSYAYYVLNEEPDSYKELSVENGRPEFGPATGGHKNLAGVSANINCGDSNYGDYQITVEGLPDTISIVYGVVLHADNGSSYGLRHMENIWRSSNLAFSTGHKTEVHGCELSPAHYAALEGQTITGITYYTDDGIYEIDADLECLPYAAQSFTASTSDWTVIQLSNLPEDLSNATVKITYTEGRNTEEVYAGNLLTGSDSALLTLESALDAEKTYTVTVSDSNYAAMSAQITAEEAEGQYVLMNIPYDKFYDAEIQNDIGVDAVSSATLNKPRTGTLVNGSYHANADGSDISGVTFPVKVEAGVDLSAYTQITDESSVEITVTNRGQTTTTTYTGKEALFEKPDYAYYALTEEPAYYKRLAADGNFSKVVGDAPKTLSDASAELVAVSSYGDYQITVKSESLDTSKVYGVTLTTTDGSGYGLRHLENIWRGSNLAFCTGFTTSVHGSPTSSSHYASIMGKTISRITYYTENGIYEIAVNLPVPVKSYQTVPALVDGAEKQVKAVQIKAGDGTVSYDFSKLDTSDTGTFANGGEDAYLVTIDGKTELVGDKTLARWTGTWESWEKYLDQSGKISVQYPYLSRVWQLAYQAYIAALQAAGVDMSATIPNVSALQAYWKNIATTKDVETMEITAGGHGSYAVKWLDANGAELHSGNYVMTGKLLKGFEGAPAYVFTAQGEDADGNYKYLIAMEPGMEGTEKEPVAKHYHFQFGSSLEDMLVKGELYNSTDYGTNETTGRPAGSNLKDSQWYATVIDAEATALAKYNVILGMHQADKWSSLPSTGGGSKPSGKPSEKPSASPNNEKPSEDNNKDNTPQNPSAGTTGFTDVPAGKYYTDAVAWAVARGITTGSGANTFGPDDACTRGQVVTFLWRAQGQPESTGSSFADVRADAYYAKAVAWAVANGVTVGLDSTRFAPNDTVTRAQFVTFLYRAAGSPAVSGSSVYTDVRTDAYYYSAVLWAAQQGITSGTSAALFSPDAPCSRGQVVTFLYRYMGA